MNPMSIEDKLAVNKYDIDRDIHIKIREDICEACDGHYCLYACPAECFRLEEGRIIFSYEGCLECGSCRIACDRGAIDWILPRPGFGICYEYG
jgi:ferredoxin like protein